MFKEESSEQELFEQMKKNEIKIAFENNNRELIEKLRTLEKLDKAAEIFEANGYFKKAEKITRLMTKLSEMDKLPTVESKEKNKKDKKKSDVQMFGIFGFSPDDLKELEIDGFNDAEDEWEDE